jgi:hypothetical protein
MSLVAVCYVAIYGYVLAVVAVVLLRGVVGFQVHSLTSALNTGVPRVSHTISIIAINAIMPSPPSDNPSASELSEDDFFPSVLSPTLAAAL